jgi:hypothetical protein
MGREACGRADRDWEARENEKTRDRKIGPRIAAFNLLNSWILGVRILLRPGVKMNGTQQQQTSINS